ncbi:MAG: phosphotransferase [Chloroflexi bacterium]|nr:phosphotransferase [Chloroflexota bacterium]
MSCSARSASTSVCLNCRCQGRCTSSRTRRSSASPTLSSPTCRGRPISDLLVGATQQARDGVFFEAGRLPGLVHSEPVEHIDRLSDESRESWGAYMRPRLRRRLAPHQSRGLLDSAETELLVGWASRLPLTTPRLLHMDFRPVNLLGEAVGESIEITGVVDAANCLAGDPAFDLARLEEGQGLEGVTSR